MKHAVLRVLAGIATILWALIPGVASAQAGQWANGPNLPYFPVHLNVLANGTVLMWPGDGGVSGDDPRRWDPISGTVTALPRAGYDLFCSSHTFLADGRLLVTGGHRQNNIGLAEATLYDPLGNTWERLPQMNDGRWYPTSTALANGDVLVVSGDRDVTGGINTLPQVWQAQTRTWRSLTAAELVLPLYPYMFLAPNGKVFNAGPDVTTRYLDATGSGTWSAVGQRTYPHMRDFAGAVTYAPGKVLMVGGGYEPTATAEVIDLNHPAPAWRAVASMTYPRQQMNATMLPDGKVLATGGSSGPGFNDRTRPVFPAEIWDPSTEKWTVAASASVPRLYHSTAMLLPDGRVLTTGGNGYTQSEIFSPPYLSAGPRPTISSAPASVQRGQRFTLSTPDAASITEVSWIRAPSVTHTNSMSQGFIKIPSSELVRGPGWIEMAAPVNLSLAPGYYFLFLLRDGVPSEAKIVQLAQAQQATNPIPVLSAIAPTSATAGGPAFNLTVSGANFLTSSQVLWNGLYRATTFANSNQLSAAIPASDLAVAGTAHVTVATPAPGGGTSAAKPFTINPVVASNPVPTLTSISPNNAKAGRPAFTLTVSGTNFVGTSKVLWNGTERATSYGGPGTLSAAIPASDIAAIGTAKVSVRSPTPGGGSTPEHTFRIKK